MLLLILLHYLVFCVVSTTWTFICLLLIFIKRVHEYMFGSYTIPYIDCSFCDASQLNETRKRSLVCFFATSTKTALYHIISFFRSVEDIKIEEENKEEEKNEYEKAKALFTSIEVYYNFFFILLYWNTVSNEWIYNNMFEENPIQQ